MIYEHWTREGVTGTAQGKQGTDEALFSLAAPSIFVFCQDRLFINLLNEWLSHEGIQNLIYLKNLVSEII